jgi:uncharacterized coiled-coil protein SlyX
MSMADAARTRELEARVAALEARVAELENGAAGQGSQQIRLMQGQINSLRAQVDRLVPGGGLPPLSGTTG